MLSTFEQSLQQINNKFVNYITAIEESLQKKEFTEEFFLIDLKEFDNEVIKFLALFHPQGEYLREVVAYLKISSFLAKIKKSTKSFIKKYDFEDEKIDALYQNALSTIDTLKLAVKGDTIEDAYSTIISYEKIADEIYKDLVLEVKQKENVDEILKILNIAKKLERISDSAKTIASYLLFAKEGLEL
ncbi:PhoU family transcriptional regulator [Nautilia sp. PV-1]|jgi:phosphate transport system protein|uniref:PhoU domain-containing protein n=1 Tax=Nautilia sp. PV-1 TaxID=2579250 RepID=UPI000FDC0F10|nr:PhoU domain-containing protein [Nautilia sp. PV-1]AZV46004.1 PhoU family transcriptional regulator [Nautilia sp. PV-1]